MPENRRQQERQRCKWAAACGELDAMGMLIDQLTTNTGRLRDQGAPEDVLEDLTITLARLRETRKAVSSASRRLWTRVEAMRRQRLSPTMIETLIAMLNRNTYPADMNNSRTFASLEEHGLIQPDIEGNWSLTDTGHQTALKLLRR
ncbi:hypothetical protein [Bifidobacterium adolescentis]|uniref:hypothetical protein n=1 Tax=Bifidobacterium adolescentis TaxID=1680 RepID=UPI0015C46DB0|nr:hypothetical protein [Bifidobacterium adolescentis]